MLHYTTNERIGQDWFLKFRKGWAAWSEVDHWFPSAIDSNELMTIFETDSVPS